MVVIIWNIGEQGKTLNHVKPLSVPVQYSQLTKVVKTSI